MRRLSFLITLLASALFLLPITLAQGQDQTVQPVPIQDVASVAIADHYFDVADIAIEPGTTVLWVNEGKVPHTVTADDGSFDSGELNPGDSYIVTFLGSGRLSYHCQLHSEMVGSVTVGGESRGGEAPPSGPQYSDLPTYEDLGHAIVPTEPRYSDKPTYEDPGHAIVPTGPQYSDKPTYEDPGHAIV
jgi:plastocyanin